MNLDKYFAGYHQNFARMIQWFHENEKLIEKNSSTSNNQLEKNHRVRSAEYNQRKRSRNKKKRKTKQKRDKSINERNSSSSKNCENDSYELEMLVTEEMKEFYRISLQHKKEKGEQRCFIFNLLIKLLNKINSYEIPLS